MSISPQLLSRAGKAVLLFAAAGIAAKFVKRAKEPSRSPLQRFRHKAVAVARGKKYRNGLNPTEVATRHYLLYFVIPVWIGAGLLDWYWHRKTKIETTSGTEESLIHALMMTEVGLPVFSGLLLQINAGSLLSIIAAYFIHETTAFWDVAYASDHRDVQPREQHTHSFLEMIPFCAVSFMLILHWDQFAALFGKGDTKPDFSIRWKEIPVRPSYIAGALAALGAGIALPYGEEIYRCWQAEKQGLVGTDTPLFVKERVAEKEKV